MSIIRKKIIIPTIGATIFLLVALFGFSGLLKDRTSSTKYADWMSSLDDNTSLRAVNMPGSHDTMALYSIGDFAHRAVHRNRPAGRSPVTLPPSAVTASPTPSVRGIRGRLPSRTSPSAACRTVCTMSAS